MHRTLLKTTRSVRLSPLLHHLFAYATVHYLMGISEITPVDYCKNLQRS